MYSEKLRFVLAVTVGNEYSPAENANVFSYFLSLKLGQGVCLKSNKGIKMGWKGCNYL